MQSPVISILTPFKNTSKFLNECLLSIINQSFTNWELLIIDDHSTDDSYQVVNAFAEKESRIKLYKNSGNGIIDALQLAFSLSKGRFITRMDSDDLMHPEKLQTMLNDLQTHGRQHIALGLVTYFNENGLGNGFKNYEKWLNTLTSSGSNFNEIYKECVIPSPCWMVHKTDLIACDAFNPKRYPEDYDLAFRFYKQGFKCIPAQKTLHQWRDYNTRASRTQAHYAENHFIDLKLQYFLELDYNTTRPLTLWGAGTKGKIIAKKLKALQIPFIWICDNPKKIGKHIYDIELYEFRHLNQLYQPQSIVSVANKTAQEDIKMYFKTQNMKAMVDYYFFC